MLNVVKVVKDNKEYYNLVLVVEENGYTYNIPLKPVFDLKRYEFNAYRNYLTNIYKNQNTNK